MVVLAGSWSIPRLVANTLSIPPQDSGPLTSSPKLRNLPHKRRSVLRKPRSILPKPRSVLRKRLSIHPNQRGAHLNRLSALQ